MQRKKSFIMPIIAAVLIGLVALYIGAIVGAVISIDLYTNKLSPSNIELLSRASAGTELAFAFDQSKPIVAEFRTACEMNRDGLSGNEINTHPDTSMDQVSALLQELRGSSVPEEWSQSIVLYIQALEYYNEYLEKAKEYVNIANSDPDKGETFLRSMSTLLARACGQTELSANAITIAELEDVEEVKTFLSKYPNATKWVDRWSDSSGSTVVNYMVDNNAAKDKATGYVDGVWVGDYRALILRVFLGDDGKPQEMYVDCHDDKDSPRIYDNILNYIETETCLGI